jgi:putative flavoprotein involved in K+ transport
VHERIETVVVGAGQAGLAVSHLLTTQGREHMVLERGRVGETWRTRCWDAFHLNTPNWTLLLPGHEYAGDDPDAFLTLPDVIAYLDDYADGLRQTLRLGVEVLQLEQDGAGRFRVQTSADTLEAANVVVATGAFQQPRLGPQAKSAGVLQLHTSEYRNPSVLLEGGVLVVGSGQSGCQIAEELLRAGKHVYLSVGRCPWAPRRYRGRDLVHWMIDLGLMDETVDRLPSPDAVWACNPALSGNDGGHDCNPLTLEREGAVLLGRLEQLEDGKALFAPDLEENLAKGAAFDSRFKSRVDEYVRANDLDAAEEPTGRGVQSRRRPVRELDLRRSGIGAVVWASGFRPDFGWIKLPVLDDSGRPLHVRGISRVPGLSFVGLHWLYKRKSGLLLGVGEDAEHVVAGILHRSDAGA